MGGLGGLLEKLQQGGHGEVAKTWVDSGQNRPIQPGSLGSALGPSIIKALSEKTGLSEQEVTAQLSQLVPGFVDKLTPQGRLLHTKNLPGSAAEFPRAPASALGPCRFLAVAQ